MNERSHTEEELERELANLKALLNVRTPVPQEMMSAWREAVAEEAAAAEQRSGIWTLTVPAIVVGIAYAGSGTPVAALALLCAACLYGWGANVLLRAVPQPSS